MSISGITSAAGIHQIAAYHYGSRLRKEYTNLGDALQAGDLAGAQNAVLVLRQLQQGFQARSSGSASPDRSVNGPSKVGIDAITKALQIGDLAAARDAYTKMVGDGGNVNQAREVPPVGSMLAYRPAGSATGQSSVASADYNATGEVADHPIGAIVDTSA